MSVTELTREIELARGLAEVAGQRAIYWLRDDDGFRTWCAVAGLDPEVIRARVLPDARHPRPDLP